MLLSPVLYSEVTYADIRHSRLEEVYCCATEPLLHERFAHNLACVYKLCHKNGLFLSVVNIFLTMLATFNWFTIRRHSKKKNESQEFNSTCCIC